MLKPSTLTSILVTLLLSHASVEAKKWEVYEGCTLAPEGFFDGDSFKIQAKGRRKTIFRLYGVDCAETDNRFPRRNAEQAEAFGIPVKDVIMWGEKAKAFTKKFFKDGCTIYTKKAKARGAGKKVRYYAIVVNSKGERLGEALMKAGLARDHGVPTEWKEPFWGEAKLDLPRKVDEKKFMRDLHLLMFKAQKAKVGVWKK